MIIDKLNRNDYIKLGIQWLWTSVVGCVLGLLAGNRIDLVFVYSLFTMLYLVCFAYSFEHFFVHEDVGLDIHKALLRCVKWYVLCLGITALLHILPYEIHLYLVVGAIMCSVAPTHLGLVQSILIVLTVQLCGETNPFEMLYAIMLVILGMMCSNVFSKYKYSFESALIICGVSFATFFMSTYCNEYKVSVEMAVHGLVEGFANLAFLIATVPFLNIKKVTIQTINFGEAIEDDFPMALAMKTISEEKYRHGRKVSLLCYHCAKKIGLDENLACCAGLYYSLCDSDIEEPIKHAVSMAEEYRLPVDVRRIISEYQGRNHKISTPEAALVDLIDEAVSTFEKNTNSDSLGFGKQMIIMGKFEELSSAGRYDYSGLSINMFLRIRKYLIEEANLDEIIYRE